MKYAIIFTTGKQFLIFPEKYQIFNSILKLNFNIGDYIFFNKIIFIRKKKNFSIGNPFLNNVYIMSLYIKKIKGPKILILKNKPKKNYTKIKGYRPLYNSIIIKS
jgi:large subunit ribosomal protein L21